MKVESNTKANEIAEAIRQFWIEESESWDEEVASDTPESSAPGIWDSMPEVDSKAVARMSRIFEQHLGIPLDVKLIQPGGYASIDEVINHLVQPMIEKAAEESSKE